MLKDNGMEQSMSRVHCCIDNGPMEGFWGILKCEIYHYGKKYEKVIHHAIVNNLFGFGYTKKSCNAQGSSKYYLFVTAPFLIYFYHNST